MIDRERGLELQRRALAAWLRATAVSSAGAHSVERDGVTAAVVPATPERSVVNSVTFRDAATLGGALEDLAAAYDAAGVLAWTVWTPEHDRAAISLLESAGHRFDGSPAAMVLELADLPPLGAADAGELDWDARASARDVGLINDLAYGFPPGTFAGAIGSPPPGVPLRLYQARADGEPACALVAVDAGGDCGIYYVATLERHRGRGLARRLLHLALAEARERGLRTSTLQATSMGRPVYERLGYRAICRLHMYERRR